MSIFLPARWLAVLPALTVFSAAGQTDPASVAPPGNAILSFRSSMEGYKPFADEKPIAWKQANEVAQQRGGWRAYAKEGAGEAESTPARAPHPHAGHTMPEPMAQPPKGKP